MVGFFRDAFLTSNIAPHVPSHKSESPASQGQTEDKACVGMPAAFPMVQPMKAALYFENAEGFGDWRILISTRADRDLRETRKKDPNALRIIVKKIKYICSATFDRHLTCS